MKGLILPIISLPPVLAGENNMTFQLFFDKTLPKASEFLKSGLSFPGAS